MPSAYSEDLRIRVIRAVEAGSSARAAGRQLAVSASTAVKWVQRWRQTGSVAAKPMGGAFQSPLNRHGEWILGLIAKEPDLTVKEVQERLRQEGIAAGFGSVWRFFDRHGISFKKNRSRRRAGSAGRRRGSRTVAG